MSDSFYSIGEVLDLLQLEFDDITISKIRFLEAQGLLSPERTPSGYRKFNDDDVEQLRWVLAMQRDHFLPLRVIKERLDSGEIEAPRPGARARGGLTAVPPLSGVQTDVPMTAIGGGIDAPTGGAYRLVDLVEETGISGADLRELASHGLIAGVGTGDDTIYDSDTVEVIRAAMAFRELGVEPRILRMYKVAVEREAGFYEQLLAPQLHHRNEEIRGEGRAALSELVELADRLRFSLLRQALRSARSR